MSAQSGAARRAAMLMAHGAASLVTLPSERWPWFSTARGHMNDGTGKPGTRMAPDAKGGVSRAKARLFTRRHERRDMKSDRSP